MIMFGKIVYISDNIAHINIPEGTPVAENLMNMNVVFEGNNQKILGEVVDVSKEIIKVHFLGEIINNDFIPGVLRKPTMQASIRLINNDELELIVGKESTDTFRLGYSPLYENKPIYIDINELCSNHLAIFGNTGSGKSYGVASFIQSLFYNKNFQPYRANYFIFDAYGEYHTAFSKLSDVNPNYQFKFYTTNRNQTDGDLLCIPLWLLSIDDYALLLEADTHSQLTIIERMLKLVRIFATDDNISNEYKNHLIASAIMDIMYTNQTCASKRNDIFSIISSCSTDQFSLNTPVQGLGYVRQFKDCFEINTSGTFVESNLITEYVTSFIKPDLEKLEPTSDHYFNLNDLERALQFTLISEGLLRNDHMYNEAITLKVRLHSLAISENAVFFNYPKYITTNEYIATLVSKNNRKAQIINFNLEDIDDRLAKTIVKIYSKLLFNFTKGLKARASIPFHLVIEESHRYIQNDGDVKLLGYNIFERIAKEGRKFGMILNLISQRPMEISETVISQCINFMIFKMTHPKDLDYIEKMLPNISHEIIEKQKSLQPGTCVAFGKAFKVPMIIHMPLPNPEPYSSNADIVATWKA